MADHEHRMMDLIAGILRHGVSGAFRPDIDPALDAYLLQRFVLAAAPSVATRSDGLADRVIAIAHRIVA